MHQLLKKLSDEEKEELIKKKMPSFTAPMLAVLTENYFSDPDWIFERKLDGERVLTFFEKNKATLKSRNDKIINHSYPEIVQALEKSKHPSMILDGEMVAFDGKISSFAKLSERFGVKNLTPELRKTKIYYYLFDIIYFDGYDLTHLPLLTRKHILNKAMRFKDPIRYTVHKNEKGAYYRQQACSKGWEGVIGKKKTSRYLHKRSSNWLKFKCVHEQELVIAGYTSPQGSRIGFGAILVGYYQNGKLKYAGKVGTGFNTKLLQDMRAEFDKLAIDKNPFDQQIKEKNTHWIKPKMVGQIGFTQWTSDNKLRHPRFLGLRRDKKAKDVIKEE